MRILKLFYIINFGRVGLASKITAKMQIPANSCTSIKVMDVRCDEETNSAE